MTPTPSQAAAPAIQTRQQLDAVLENIAHLQRERDELYDAQEKEIAAVRQRYRAPLAEMEHVPRGAITVGANEGTCLHILPEVFADFKQQYPGVSVNIQRSDYAKILESVTDNSVDFGVVSLPVKDNRLTVVLIHQDELVIIAPPHHPLGKMKSAPVGDLAKYPLVLPKAGHTRDALDELFRERRLKPNYSMELDSSELLKRFVAAGVGVGFIARSNVQEDVRAGVLVRLLRTHSKRRPTMAWAAVRGTAPHPDSTGHYRLALGDCAGSTS